LATQLVSSVEQGLLAAYVEDVSGDGRYVVFGSRASNLVAGDTNDRLDVFLRDLTAGTTSRVSVTKQGSDANNDSYGGTVSLDGRFVAFSSRADNLVEGDFNWREDVFVKDMLTGDLALVSTDSAERQADGTSMQPSISADGRYVAFHSNATNLTAGDLNEASDVFVKDLATGSITRDSTDQFGREATGWSYGAKISDDGRTVAFLSDASNLVSNDTNGVLDVFVKDRVTGVITRANTNRNGVQANGAADRASISADGRRIAFQSSASNLISDDHNELGDVFVKDLATGMTIRVSEGSLGNEANGLSLGPCISSDGQFVVFSSDASNLAPDDGNETADIFVKSLQTGALSRVSRSTLNAQANGHSGSAVITDDGSFVAFDSTASNLAPSDTDVVQDVFVRDLLAGETLLVSSRNPPGPVFGNGDSYGDGHTAISFDGESVAFLSLASNLVGWDTNGNRDVFVRGFAFDGMQKASEAQDKTEADGGSFGPSISADGRFVAFFSEATNLVPNDTNGLLDVFLKDMGDASVARVSVADSGSPANGNSYRPAVSHDGRYIAFESDANNLLSSDTNNVRDIFVRDMQTGLLLLASTSTSANQGNAAAENPSLSADGRFVAYDSTASNLVANDTNQTWDIFVKDMVAGLTIRASSDAFGRQSDGMSMYPSLSADGRLVAFASDASNLVPGDNNGSSDIFVKDITTGRIQRASSDRLGNEANGASRFAALSADGRHVVFESLASNLVTGDTNLAADVFAKNLQTGAVVRISVDTQGHEADAGSHHPGISADGRYVAFYSLASNLVTGDVGRADVFRVSLYATERGTWQNSEKVRDVNADGSIAPVDALVVINELNGPLFSDPRSAELYVRSEQSAPFYDVNADNFCTPLDALFIINYLNGTSFSDAPEAERPSRFSEVGDPLIGSPLLLLDRPPGIDRSPNSDRTHFVHSWPADDIRIWQRVRHRIEKPVVARREPRQGVVKSGEPVAKRLDSLLPDDLEDNLKDIADDLAKAIAPNVSFDGR
jgi:Tol biopolymer transport system component